MQLKNDELIKKWEALRLKAYLPTKDDKWTIGWGHTVGVTPGMVITEARAQELFDSDVAWATKAVNTKVKVGLTQHQFDALTSFVFNIGETAFSTSTLLRKLNAGDYEGAAAQFPRWIYQDGKVLNGLVKRRAEEMAYFLEADEAEPAQNFLAENPINDTLKPLTKSKEILLGSGAAISGVATLFTGLNPWAQNVLIMALIVFGVGVVANRLYARWKAER